jgi:hypothetical protein
VAHGGTNQNSTLLEMDSTMIGEKTLLTMPAWLESAMVPH